MPAEDFSRLPKADAACLKPVPAADIAAAYVASQKNGCRRIHAKKALGKLFVAESALHDAVKAGLIEDHEGMLRGRGVKRGTCVKQGTWADAKRDFAFRALGVPAPRAKAAQRDLAGAALRCLYALDTLPPSPSRARARCELLSRIAVSYGKCRPVKVGRTGKVFSFDPVSRSLYLGFAGLKSGTVVQADAALLSAALGGPASTVADLSTTILRAAFKAHAPKPVKTGEVAFNLDGFAQSVRTLAVKLETKPYRGRVAIAQVYDAGLAEGLNLGTLDEFKSHLADAAREGLLDLERYDIAGPFDASLKERSRLRLGRDERHFIVNQWI